MAPMHFLAVITWLIIRKLAGNEARHHSVELMTRSSDGAALCALDHPTVSKEMSSRIPDAPAAVRCGMTCSEDAGCKHFNYISTESNPCQLYHYRPTNFDVSPNCQHYHVPDMDECAVNNGGCSEFATCTNVPDSFNCTCDAGYTGDGFNCTDVDECAVNHGECSDLATCNNAPGSFTCTCNDGYTGDGFNCTDVDECSSNNGGCDSNAVCANQPGSFTCTCNTNYIGNGSHCEFYCPVNSGFTYNSGSKTCLKVATGTASWSSAAGECHDLNQQAHLVVISSAAKQAVVKNVLEGQSSNCPQIGTHGRIYLTALQRTDPNAETSFQWKVSLSNGTVVKQQMIYDNWHIHQPSFTKTNNGPQSCMGMHADWSYEWNDLSCSKNLCFVCEIDP